MIAIVLLLVVFYSSTMWFIQSMQEATDRSVNEISTFFLEEIASRKIEELQSLLNDNGDVQGIVNELQESDFGYDLILQDGSYAAVSSDGSLSGENFLDVLKGSASFSERSSLTDLEKNLTGGRSGEISYTIEGTTYYTYYAPIQGTEWYLLTTTHHGSVRHGIRSLHGALLRTSLLQLLLMCASMFAIFMIYRSSRRRRLQLELERVHAREGDKAKSEFFSNMSHDIRTPMNAIIGFTNLALENKDDLEKTQDYLIKIQSSSNQLLTFVNDVLDMSRIEGGIIQLDETPCNLSEMMHDLGTIIIGQIQEKQQKLLMSTINVRNENIYCDKMRFNQILINLLSNAIKFTPEGGTISVSLLQTDDAPEGYGAYELRVRDTGIGMSREFADRIFDPFEREDSTEAKGEQGTGLGMAITKNIVDLMHGTIEVVTGSGKGTRFTISVPLKLQDHERPGQIRELSGRRALVVDSDLDACNGLTKLLVDLGMRAEWTTSGAEAIELTGKAADSNNEFRVFIVDQTLPDQSGIQICRQIQQLSHGSDPIIIMTTYDRLRIKEEAVTAGVNSFLCKPVFLSDLHLTLGRIIDHTDFPEEAEEAVEHVPSETEGTANFEGRRILLVDDNDLNREVAIAILGVYGFVIDEAVDGADAVNQISASRPGYYDVVLMDVRMPVMNGYEATRAIRALEDPQLRRIPIIAMTANAFEEDKKEALEAGMNGHVAKPIDVEQLLGALREILR